MFKVTPHSIVLRQRSPLHSRTYRPKDTPDFVPTGRYQQNSLPEQPEEPVFEEFPATRQRGKKPAKQKKDKPLPPINEKIIHPYITYIDDKGLNHGIVERDTVLTSFDKSKYTLVEVDGESATCRLFTVNEFREHLRKLGHKSPLETKEIQMTWNIGVNDLHYRLQRAIKAMEKGGRCTLIIGARNPKLVRSKKEREEMVQTIRTTLAPHAFEWKEMAGGFPSAEISFQGHPPTESPSQIPDEPETQKEVKPSTSRKEKVPAAEVEAARMAEINQAADPTKTEKQKETQEKLRSVAAQFSTLGAKKSLFGRIGAK